MKEWLLGKTLADLTDLTAEYGMPKFTAKQIAKWIYGKRVSDISEMSDISAKNRAILEANYIVGRIPHADVQESSDGTKKYLFPTLGGNFIESAYIPDKERATLCVSSQAGCKMGCKFCMTARQGFQHNLTSGEIINQIISIPESQKLTNIVYMGMGEPLDNLEEVIKSIEILTSEWGFGWSPTRITLSTIGILPALDEFIRRTKVHLAVSLHNPFADERMDIMPLQRIHALNNIISTIKRYDFTGQRRVSFEYIMFRGINDTPRHQREITKIMGGLKCRFNLIRFHSIPDSDLEGTPYDDMIKFRDGLSAKGITTTIRASRGEDIFAACGMLSTAKNR
ncbi:MAG: 23S rRNA (adenine(2503)-C(2))-methyltransferase RlmN [Rikenellaceae bacterium]|nr:23S rRNA (adenine(2503)-C(2))-methyltransferase RlmN [Rikenellaceae bacterium]